MKHRILIAAVAAAFLVAGLPALAKDDKPRTITVQGTGEAIATPDIARVNVGVVTEGDSAGKTLSANNDAMARLFKVLNGFDIAERDRQTSGFNVSPRYSRPGRDGGAPEIVGYRVTNQVSIRVRKLGDVGALLDALVKDGANQIQSIGFTLDDPRSALDQARKNAITDAKRRAKLYAKELGVDVGDVLTVTELASRGPVAEFAAPRLAVAKAVPVAPGEQTFSASVTVVFELED
jgi:hypothetical protein